MQSFLTHNGTLTIVSKKSGEHRTLRCRTETFKDGSEHRVISLLIGPDRYLPFAFVRDGAVSVWRRHRNSETKMWLASAIAYPERFESKANFLMEGTCRKCGRALTTPESIKSGIGPICAKKA